jgi:hypothetical protein
VLDARREYPGSSLSHRGGAEIGGEHLDRQVAVLLTEELQEADDE